jgi:hypothetical protein
MIDYINPVMQRNNIMSIREEITRKKRLIAEFKLLVSENEMIHVYCKIDTNKDHGGKVLHFPCQGKPTDIKEFNYY